MIRGWIHLISRCKRVSHLHHHFENLTFSLHPKMIYLQITHNGTIMSRTYHIMMRRGYVLIMYVIPTSPSMDSYTYPMQGWRMYVLDGIMSTS